MFESPAVMSYARPSRWPAGNRRKCLNTTYAYVGLKRYSSIYSSICDCALSIQNHPENVVSQMYMRWSGFSFNLFQVNAHLPHWSIEQQHVAENKNDVEQIVLLESYVKNMLFNKMCCFKTLFHKMSCFKTTHFVATHFVDQHVHMIFDF